MITEEKIVMGSFDLDWGSALHVSATPFLIIGLSYFISTGDGRTSIHGGSCWNKGGIQNNGYQQQRPDKP